MKEGVSLNASGIIVSATMDSIPIAASAVMKAIEKPEKNRGQTPVFPNQSVSFSFIQILLPAIAGTENNPEDRHQETRAIYQGDRHYNEA